jgi:type IV secretion system protein VirB9
VLTHRPDGSLRPNLFEVETHPNICPPRLRQPGPNDPQVPNLQLISQNALGPGSREMYALIFRYPLDAWKKRLAAVKSASERAERRRTKELLRRAADADLPGGGPAPGRNYAYVRQGAMALAPEWIWDDGMITKMIFPENQRPPAIFYVTPDGHEASIVPSAHENGDVLVFNVVAPEWILRDGGSVLAIGNRGYNPIGHNPGTGTITPHVRRIVKDSDAR